MMVWSNAPATSPENTTKVYYVTTLCNTGSKTRLETTETSKAVTRNELWRSDCVTPSLSPIEITFDNDSLQISVVFLIVESF